MLLWSNKVWPNASLWLNHRNNNSGTHDRGVHLYSRYKANTVALEKEPQSYLSKTNWSLLPPNSVVSFKPTQDHWITRMAMSVRKEALIASMIIICVSFWVMGAMAYLTLASCDLIWSAWNRWCLCSLKTWLVTPGHSYITNMLRALSRSTLMKDMEEPAKEE